VRRAIAGALALGLAVATALAGCASTPPRDPGEVAPGLFPQLVSACLAQSGLHGDVTVQASADGGFSVSSDRDIFSSGGWIAMEDCVHRHPFDRRLGDSDSVRQRRVLAVWYRSTLIPCLQLRGVQVPSMPPEADFEKIPYGYWDPYSYIPEHSLDLAQIGALQRDCPPAPPVVLALAGSGPTSG
jgi:hypothetical protein